MKQFRKILSFELRYYMKNKVFVGVTLFLVALLALVMFFPRISAALENPNDPEVQEKEIMLVSVPQESMIEIFVRSFPDYQVEYTDKDAQSIQDSIRNEEADCAFVLNDFTAYTYYVGNLSLDDMNPQTADAALQHAYRIHAMAENGLTPEQAQEIMDFQISGTVENLGKDQAKNFFYTYIMIFALYMVILMYGQMIATNVASEKSSRAMELLITSAKPTSMMFGKVIASCMAGFIQLAVVFGSAFLFYNLNADLWGGNMIMNSLFNMPLSLLLYMLLFFVLGFLIYAFLYGAIGSTASRLEDINTSVMPITLLFVIAFMVVMFSMSSGNADSTLMKVCSYIPFTSPMAMFTRIAMCEVPWYEIAASVALLIVSAIGIGALSAKIYRVGVLLYGTPPKPAAILKALRNS